MRLRSHAISMASKSVVALLTTVRCGDPELVAADLQVTFGVDDLEGLVALLSGADETRFGEISAAVDGISVMELRRLRSLAEAALSAAQQRRVEDVHERDDDGPIHSASPPEQTVGSQQKNAKQTPSGDGGGGRSQADDADLSDAWQRDAENLVDDILGP